MTVYEYFVVKMPTKEAAAVTVILNVFLFSVYKKAQRYEMANGEIVSITKVLPNKKDSPRLTASLFLIKINFFRLFFAFVNSIIYLLLFLRVVN